MLWLALTDLQGCGYHLDMLWVGIGIAICSILGLPFIIAATVRCVAHMQVLTVWSKVRHASADTYKC